MQSHYNSPSEHKHWYRSMPSTQTPPFWHGFDSHSSRFTSQNGPPKPAAHVKKERGEKKDQGYWNPLRPVSFLRQLGSAWLCFHKQKLVFKAHIDSQRSPGTCRLSSLDHLIMFNKSQSLPLWFITLNKPNLVIFKIKVNPHIKRTARNK